MRKQTIRFLSQDETNDRITKFLIKPDITIGVRDQEDLTWHLFYDERVRSCDEITIGDQDGEGVLIWLPPNSSGNLDE